MNNIKKVLVMVVAGVMTGMSAFADGSETYDNGKYVKVKYIESTGNRFFDTGVPANTANLVTVVDMLVDEAYINGDYPIFGSTWAANGFFMVFHVESGVQGIRFHTGGVWQDVPRGDTTWQPNTRMRLVGTKHGFWVNDNWYELTGGDDSSNSVDLFKVHGNNTCGAYRLYSCMITNEVDGTIYRNFVPVRDTTNNAGGLYDIQNNQYYASGSEPFIAGPDDVPAEELLLSVSRSDFSQFNAVLRWENDDVLLPPTSATEVYASNTLDGVVTKLATVPAGRISYTDTTCTVGVPVYYWIADAADADHVSKPVKYVKIRRLERTSSDPYASLDAGFDVVYTGSPYSGGDARSNALLAFDGHTSSAPDMVNPADGYIGVDFGKSKYHVALVNMLPRNDWTYGVLRVDGSVVYGSNTGNDNTDHPISDAFVYDTSVQTVRWCEIECDPTDAYRYFYLVKSVCCANYAEIQFYGWSDDDLPSDDPLVIDGESLVADGYNAGDVVRLYGQLSSVGSGVKSVRFETSALGDFTDAVAWDAVYTSSDDGITAYIRDTTPTDPTYLVPNATLYYRLVVTDNADNVLTSDPVELTLPGNFGAGPALPNIAFAINGRLVIYGVDLSRVVVQRCGADGETWTTVTGFSYDASSGYNYGPDQSLRGVTKLRFGYVPINGGEICNWSETLEVDARHPMYGSMLCVGGSWDNNATPPHAVDGLGYTWYEPAQANYNTDKMWVGMDLGGDYAITSVCVMPRYGNDGNCEGSVFEYASDPDFTDAKTIVTATGVQHILIKWDLAEPIVARYVRFKKYDGWFNVSEIEFDVAADAPMMKTVCTDYTTGYPTLTFSELFSPEYGVCVYRSEAKERGYQLVGTLDAGVTSFVDADPKMPYGRPQYYRLARRTADGVEGMYGERSVYQRPHRLERTADDNTKLKKGVVTVALDYNSLGRPFSYDFDGDLASNSESGSNNNNDPALGVDFGDGNEAYVCHARLYPRNDSWEYGIWRANGVAVCALDSIPENGSGEGQINYNSCTAWLQSNMIMLSRIVSEPDLAWATWVDLDCDSTKPHRYIMLWAPYGHAWCGNMSELELYGWTEKDLHPSGMFIFVK